MIKLYINIKKENNIKNETIQKEFILLQINNDVQNYLRKHPKIGSKLGTPNISDENIINDIFMELKNKYKNFTINDLITQITKNYNEYR